MDIPSNPSPAKTENYNSPQASHSPKKRALSRTPTTPSPSKAELKRMQDSQFVLHHTDKVQWEDPKPGTKFNHDSVQCTQVMIAPGGSSTPCDDIIEEDGLIAGIWAVGGETFDFYQVAFRDYFPRIPRDDRVDQHSNGWAAFTKASCSSQIKATTSSQETISCTYKCPNK